MPLSNRFHFATGVMAFVSSPLWLAFLIVGVLTQVVGFMKGSGREAGSLVDHTASYAVAVFAAIMIMLVAPRILGALMTTRDSKTLAGFGGATGLARSLVLEFLVSVLIAPIMMAFHSLFVFSTVAGHRVEWNAQSRSATGVGWRQAWYAHRDQTLAGIAATALVAVFISSALWWLSPILVGLVFSIPICMLVSNAAIGAWLKRRGWLQIPEEVEPPSIVRQFAQALYDARRLGCPARQEMFQRMLDDPLWLRGHLSMLAATGSAHSAASTSVQECEALIQDSSWDAISATLKKEVLADADALVELHRTVWTMRSVHLMSQDRLCVQVQPSVAAILTDGRGE
jgi:membrane glycosyltransferase